MNMYTEQQMIDFANFVLRTRKERRFDDLCKSGVTILEFKDWEESESHIDDCENLKLNVSFHDLKKDEMSVRLHNILKVLFEDRKFSDPEVKFWNRPISILRNICLMDLSKIRGSGRGCIKELQNFCDKYDIPYSKYKLPENWK